jgi:hypothetical protein
VALVARHVNPFARLGKRVGVVFSGGEQRHRRRF